MQAILLKEKRLDGYDGHLPSSMAFYLTWCFICRVIETKQLNLLTRLSASIVGGIGMTFRNKSKKSYFEFYNNGTACLLMANDDTKEIETEKLHEDDMDSWMQKGIDYILYS